MPANCFFTATDEQLRRDGYFANAALAQRPSAADAAGFDASHLMIPAAPHELKAEMLRLLRGREQPPLHDLTLSLFDGIRGLEADVQKWLPAYQSPVWTLLDLRLARWPKHAATWQDHADAAAPKVQALLRRLEHYYEAARLVVATRQTAIEEAMMYLSLIHI